MSASVFDAPRLKRIDPSVSEYTERLEAAMMKRLSE